MTILWDSKSQGQMLNVKPCSYCHYTLIGPYRYPNNVMLVLQEYSFKPFKPSEFWKWQASKNRSPKFKRMWILKIWESRRSTGFIERNLQTESLPLSNSNSTAGLAKLTASWLTNLKALESLTNLLRLAVEDFWDLPNLPFSEEGVKRKQIPKKKASENRTGLKELHP